MKGMSCSMEEEINGLKLELLYLQLDKGLLVLKQDIICLYEYFYAYKQQWHSLWTLINNSIMFIHESAMIHE